MAHSTAYGYYTVTILRAAISTLSLPSACPSIIFHYTPLGVPLVTLLGTVTPFFNCFMTYHMVYCTCIWVLLEPLHQPKVFQVLDTPIFYTMLYTLSFFSLFL
jgi:hypothetical protein